MPKKSSDAAGKKGTKKEDRPSFLSSFKYVSLSHRADKVVGPAEVLDPRGGLYKGFWN